MMEQNLLGFQIISMMNSITTLTFFRFHGITNKMWAFGEMQYAHAHINTTPGLRFYKLMGSGRDHGFNPLPDWGVYALLGVWENEQAATDFFAHAEIFKRYTAHSSEQWTIFLKPIQAKGLWLGGNPFVPSTNLNEANPLVAVITRASIRANKLIQFWRFVPTSQRPIQKGCEGLIYTKGVGEKPFIQMVTFSVWENMEALRKFAYQSPEHQEAIRKTLELDWYSEEMFVRFQPYRSVGIWEGQDPLARYLIN